MAAKKRSTNSETRVSPKRAASKRAAKAAPEARTKKGASAATSAAPKKAAAKKAPIRLTPKQRELLERVRAAGESGYEAATGAEGRSLDALREKKVIKRLAKNKETGKIPYAVTRIGEKFLESTPAS